MAVDVFRRHRYLFGIVGISFQEKLGRVVAALIEGQRWITLFLMFYTHCVCIILGIVLRHSEFDTIPTLVMSCGMFSGPSNFLKHLSIYKKRHIIKDLMDQLNGYEVKGPLAIFAKCLMYAYEGMSMFFTISSFLKNAVEIPDLTVPYPVWEPFEINTQPRRTAHFIMVYYAIFLCWTIVCSVDTLLLQIAMQLCHKLKALDHTYRLIGLSKEAKAAALQGENILQPQDMEDSTILRACLDEHIRLLKMTETLSTILNEVFTYQIITSMPVLLVTLYIFSNSAHWLNDIVAFSGALVVVFIQVLTSCVSGELIKSRYQQIHFAAYNNQWYDTDPSVKRSLLVVATFSSKPVILRGAYVFELSLQTYETFIKQAFSLLTIMYQIFS